eukprot:4162100-Prymnesium_polylepis.1
MLTRGAEQNAFVLERLRATSLDTFADEYLAKHAHIAFLKVRRCAILEPQEQEGFLTQQMEPIPRVATDECVDFTVHCSYVRISGRCRGHGRPHHGRRVAAARDAARRRHLLRVQPTPARRQLVAATLCADARRHGLLVLPLWPADAAAAEHAVRGSPGLQRDGADAQRGGVADQGGVCRGAHVPIRSCGPPLLPARRVPARGSSGRRRQQRDEGKEVCLDRVVGRAELQV